MFAKLHEPKTGDIWHYVAEQAGPARATWLLERLEAAASSLASMPHMGRERPRLREGLRSWSVESYIILYFPLPAGRSIVRVVHSRRNLEALFS